MYHLFVTQDFNQYQIMQPVDMTGVCTEQGPRKGGTARSPHRKPPSLLQNDPQFFFAKNLPNIVER